MSEKLNIGIKGITTNLNSLQVGDGSLLDAENINIDRGLAQSRRGFNRHSGQASVSNRIDRVTEYQDKLIVHRSDDNKMAYYNSGSWTDYSGTYSHPDSDYARMRFVQAAQNLYLTSSTGVKVLDIYSGSIYNTGMPRGLDGSGSTTGVSGFMTTNTQVAYRVVWGTRDTNNNLYLGSPSQRIIIANTSGGFRDVSLTFTIPSGITTSDFFQVYRSRESASSSSEPTDELQLVYEANPSAGEITAKSITFTDSNPNSLLGAYLYTNSNQEGISESNDEPPFAKDICFFKGKGFLFYANIKSKHVLNIKLLSVSGSGLVANDTITIDGMVFTAKAATTVASREFKVFTAGSASQNIDDTAKELIKVVNQYTSNTTVYAYYSSGYTDLPGQIEIRKRELDDVSFTVSVSRAAAWNIDDGTSDNEEYQNGLMWSKIQQGEHVPTSHLAFVGSKSYPIRRILALKDSLFILKDDGVFRLTGVNGSWNIEEFDSSTILIAPESAVVINNQIYALTNQGVCSISDIGVQVISEDIKDSFVELIGLNFDALKTKSFAIAYETDRKYILFTISNELDTYCTQAWVYNVFTQKWSRWSKDVQAGFVAPSNDKLYFANPSDKYLLEERKSYTYRDFVDEEIDGFSIVLYTGASLVLNTTLGLTIGDLVYLNSDIFSPITAIDDVTSTITVFDEDKVWTIGAVTVYKAIDCKIEWTPQYTDNSGLEKLYQELLITYKEKRFNTATMDFYTDLSGGWESVSILGDYGGGDWGLFPWGSIPWGGEARGSHNRLRVPRNKSRGQYLSIRFSCRTAYAMFSIQGLALQFDFTSERLNNG